jgi:hypothetical protein
MNKKEREIITDFTLKSRPTDRVSFIMMQEILSVLKNILKELKKDRD